MSSVELDYWERKYAGSLDSGRGSYGEEAEWKIRIVRAILIAAGCRSILDLGSGDGNIAFNLKRLLPRGVKYCGLDLSESAVEWCVAQSLPGMNFEVADVSEKIDHKADAVICLDVLFHISTKDRYEAAVRNLVDSFDRVAIVVTWDERAVDHYQGRFDGHTFFRLFEPRGVTLRKIELPMSPTKSLYILTKGEGKPQLGVFSNVKKVAAKRQRIEASISSIPQRVVQLEKCVTALLPHVDLLRVFLNGQNSVPEFLQRSESVTVKLSHKDFGDRGKFFWSAEARGVQLICDDDICYHRGYVDYLVAGLRRYRYRAAVGFHGVVLTKPQASYLDHRTVDPLDAPLREDKPVHVLGVGSMAYHADALKVCFEDFRHRDAADVSMGLLCQRQEVPMVALRRRIGLDRQSTSDEEGVGRAQAKLVRQQDRWRIHAAKQGRP